MFSDKKYSRRFYIILLIIIILQFSRIIYSFAFVKQAYHSDESWSYGLANSYYEPYIYQTADETAFTHIGKWFSSEDLRQYLTVESEHRFSYGSVFYNQTMDLHPPLYYVILHTICSFFPGKFSYWFGFSINIVCFFVLQLFLFKLSKEITKSDVIAIATCTFFGFTSGALNMFVFVRMYAMLTMIAVISSYFHARLYNTDDFKHNMPFLFFVTLAGSLTHHYYPVFAGSLSACFCFYYLLRKQIKKLFIYALTMLASVASSILAFPATINHLFGRRGKIVKYPPELQFKMSLNAIIGELTGFTVKLGKTATWAVIGSVMLFFILVSIPLIFLFRNEKWFKLFVSKVINSLKKLRLQFKITNIKAILSNTNWITLFLFISVVCLWIVVAENVSLLDMAEFVDRYLFIVYPVFCVVIVNTIMKLCEMIRIKNRKTNVVVIVAVLLFTCLSNVTHPCIYLFRKERSFDKEYSDSNIIFLTPYTHLLTVASDDFIDSNMIYMDSIDNFLDNYTDIKTDSIYLVVDENYIYENDEDEETESYSGKNLGEIKDRLLKENMTYRKNRDAFENDIINMGVFNECSYIGVDKFAGFDFSVYQLR